MRPDDSGPIFFDYFPFGVFVSFRHVFDESLAVVFMSFQKEGVVKVASFFVFSCLIPPVYQSFRFFVGTSKGFLGG